MASRGVLVPYRYSATDIALRTLDWPYNPGRYDEKSVLKWLKRETRCLALREMFDDGFAIEDDYLTNMRKHGTCPYIRCERGHINVAADAILLDRAIRLPES